MMISLIENVRAGISEPREIIRAESTKRAFSLQLSRNRNIEEVHNAGINAIDIDPSEHRYLLSGAKNGSIIIHDLQNYYGKLNYTAKSLCKIERPNPGAHRYSVECVQWYPFDSGMFVSSGMDRQIKVWDSNMMTTAHEVMLKGKIYHHEMSKMPSAHYLVAVATSYKNVTILDLKSGSSTHELSGHNSGVLTCHWSPVDDSLLATGSCDNQILLWDIRSSKSCLKSLDQHNGKGNSGKMSSVTAHDGYVNGLCFSKDGFFLISYGNDSRLRVWDIVKGSNEMVNFGTIPNHSKRAIQFDVTNCCGESDLVFVPSECKIHIYELMSGVKVNTLSGHYYCVNCCIFEPWFQELYSGGKDHNLLLWTSDGNQLECFEQGNSSNSYKIDNDKDNWSDGD